MVEDEKQRRDRELIELLNELRVALPGVQVLFSFLLVVPFTEEFKLTSDFQRGVYLTTLLLAAAASVLLMAPSSQHRLLFRRHFEQKMLFTANRLAIAGMGCLGLAIMGAVLLVTHLLFGGVAGAVAAGGAGLLIAWLWYLLPLARRNDDTTQER
jgi:O-antigen/teichoic acid export membrane protein